VQSLKSLPCTQQTGTGPFPKSDEHQKRGIYNSTAVTTYNALRETSDPFFPESQLSGRPPKQDNPSEHTMALGTAQPLTEMNTTNSSW